MSLDEKENMLNSYLKNIKKSICSVKRADLFLVFAVIILLAAPFVINFAFRINTEAKQVNLYLSARFEEIFGREITENLILEFNEQNPDLQLRLNNTAEKTSDILIFDESDFYDFSQPAVFLVSFMDLFFYNINILTAAGFDRPPKTREEFLSYAKAATGGNVYGTSISLNSRDFFPWMWASGNDFWQGGETPALNIRSAAGDIAFFGNIISGEMLPPSFNEMTAEKQLEEFARGKIAMMIASSRSIPFLREKMGDNAFGITNIPVSGSAGKYNISLSGIFASLNSQTLNQEAALRFLEFLNERKTLFCEELKAVPGVIFDIIPGDYIRDDPFYSKAQDIFESSAIVNGFFGVQRADEYENIFMEELMIFLEGGRTAEAAARTIQTRWDEMHESDH